ncbi:MAG TPA: GntR family transcriptional regulator [Acidimicrobiales bacterium]|nr:GntR family transcriptional regulator [Acidimicrobiales bacterium]
MSRRLVAARAARRAVPLRSAPRGRGEKTSERVARSIVRDIIARGLAPGDPLPSESALADHHQVSRESLREGLRLLESQGFVAIRRGSRGGPSVGRADLDAFGRMAAMHFLMAGATYDELYAAWLHAEGTLAELAATHPDRVERRRLMGPHLQPGDPGSDLHIDRRTVVAHHRRFHWDVAALVTNRVLALSLQSYGWIVGRHVPDAVGWAARPEIGAAHLEIAGAIVAGRHRKARLLMEAHVAEFEDRPDVLRGELDDVIDWW